MLRILSVHEPREFGKNIREWLGAALLLCGFAGVALPQMSQTSPVFTQAESYIQQRQYGRAIELLQEVLDKSPSDPMAHNLMGIALTSSG